MIKYYQAQEAARPTYRTSRFGNLMSDTYQGEVTQSPEGAWSGWFYNLSREETKFRFGFKSRAAAARWVNSHLRSVGVE